MTPDCQVWGGRLGRGAHRGRAPVARLEREDRTGCGALLARGGPFARALCEAPHISLAADMVSL
jgi:hypothetical protein